MSRRRARVAGLDYWPGFVDALSTMLLAFVFLTTIFMTAQFFLSRDVSGKDEALRKLNRQIAELTQMLALEQAGKDEAQARTAALSATLQTEREKAAQLAGQLQGRLAGAAAAGEAGAALDAEKKLSAEAQARVELLNQQIAALRRQLAAIEGALQASEARDKDSQARIADLGQRLNLALAQKVQELARYRSDFFGRLRGLMEGRPGVVVAGDRFVLPSDVLFESGQATLGPNAPAELDKVAALVLDVEKQIPADLPWILRVDGHTDRRPIASALYPSNWELSAARAIAVVRYLVARGVKPEHLAAAGFGEFRPLDNGGDEAALARNRRIEFKLTER